MTFSAKCGSRLSLKVLSRWGLTSAACPTPRDYPVKSFGKVQGYHSNDALVDLTALGLRSYLSEPDRGRRCWKGQLSARDAVYANRRRICGERGRRLLRCRGELLERPFAHVYETGGMRRVHLRGHPNIRKRLLVHVAGCNLGLLLRQMIGVGTPRSLQGRTAALFRALFRRFRDGWGLLGRLRPPLHATLVADVFLAPRPEHPLHFVSGRTYASGC